MDSSFVINISSNMFVANTFLNTVDRLSSQTTLTGRIGSCIGLFLTTLFIILSFVLFLGPIISYFEGDYFQSSFSTQLYSYNYWVSGTDFKMAISFRNKKTGQIMDHNSISNYLNVRTRYIAIDGDAYFAPVLDCQNSYFQGLTGAPQFENQSQCLIIPNFLIFNAQRELNSASLFNFQLLPICQNPFRCVYQSEFNEELNKLILSFFADYYYILYFTVEVINQQGQKQLVWQKLFSPESEQTDDYMPWAYAILNTQQYYIDDSVMPWRNNRTQLLISWLGHSSGFNKNEVILTSYGVHSGLQLFTDKNINFRYYKKLDWLIGMLGGGIFLLYLIFWAFWNSFSAAKAKIRACQAQILVKSNDSEGTLKQPELGISWYFICLLPDFIKVGIKQRKWVRESDNMLDIANLIKKQKVAIRNIKRGLKIKQLTFSPKILKQQQDEPSELVNQFDPQHQIACSTLQVIRNDDNVAEIYMNNPTVLSINGSKSSQKFKEQMAENYDKYSTLKVPFTEHMRSRFNKCRILVARFFRLFDAFGAKPMLTGQPYNYSFCGCILSFFIIILSVLTFALTLQNMGKPQIYMDKVYTLGQQINVRMNLNTDFKIMACFLILNFQEVFTGQQRYADIKFYQYTRDGDTEIKRFIQAQPLKQNPQMYFDISTDFYDYQVFQPYCFIPDPQQVQVAGNAGTQNQKYFGFSIKPYCGGTPAQCLQSYNDTMRIFNNILSMVPIYMFTSQNKYFPDRNQIVSDVSFTYLNQGSRSTSEVTNSVGAVLTDIKMKILQVINDQDTWIVGTEIKKPVMQTLSTVQNDQNYEISTIADAGTPYFDVKLTATGQTDRVVRTNYKIDFLLSTIGGCFIFFYFIFGCCGRITNSYLLRTRIAEEVYEQEDQRNIFQTLANILRLPCQKNRKVLDKINKEVDSIYLSQRIETLYRLSSGYHDKIEARNLSLVYLKEVVKDQDEIVFPASRRGQEQEQEDNNEINSFYSDSRLQQQQIQRELINQNGAVMNSDIMPNLTQEKILQLNDEQAQLQTFDNPLLTTNRGAKKEICCDFNKVIDNLDMFSTNAYLTLDGKRSVKSVCGGVCCIILLIFMIIVVQHFLTLYSLNLYTVSYEKKLFIDHPEKIELETGEDFMLAISFFQKGNNQWLDVSSIVDSGIQIAIIDVQTQRTNNEVKTTKTKMQLVKCQQSDFYKFIDDGSGREQVSNSQTEAVRNQFFNYKDVKNGYCVPKGQKLQLYGSPEQQKRKYFELTIRNKELTAQSFAIGQSLLNEYIPRIHISRPIQDFSKFSEQSENSDLLTYEMVTVYKDYETQNGNSYIYNITLTKVDINYDTAVNPSGEYPKVETYDASIFQFHQTVEGLISVDNTIFWDLRFYYENYKKNYVIRTTKGNELFGIVGGAILFIFFGLGVFPKSFNQYWMRMIIASKVYELRPDPKKAIMKKVRNKKGNKNIQQDPQLTLIHQMNNCSEWTVFKKWLMSFYTFLTGSFDKTKKARYRASLLESKVSNDMNIVTMLKNIHMCEDYLNKRGDIQKLTKDTNINLCRTYFKKIVPEDGVFQRFPKSDPSIKEDLRYCAKKNLLSDWDINAILIAKQTGDISPIDVFSEKWLDEFFGEQRLSSSVTASEKNQNNANNNTKQNNMRNGHRKKSITKSSMKLQDEQLYDTSFAKNASNQQLMEEGQGQYQIE